MAKQIEGVSERIIEAAKREFLENGYTDASLRTIATAADTSTNSIYVRFGDKEGLFSAIVEPVLNEMIERFIKIQEDFHQMKQETQIEIMPKYADGGNCRACRLYVRASGRIQASARRVIRHTIP